MDYMSFTVATNVIAGESSTISDLLGTAKELDVSSLKQDAPDAPVRTHVDEDEATDERDSEIDAIEAFIAKHGVTKPKPEDFKPKSQAWRSKKSAAAKGANHVERRGRPRKVFTKDLSFVQLDDGTFKRAGRGRAKKGETREVFTIHHLNVDKACAGTHTREALIAMANC